MSAVKLRSIGSSQGFVIPKAQLSKAGFSPDDEYELIASQRCISIIQRQPHHSKWIFKDPELSPYDQEWIDADLGDKE